MATEIKNLMSEVIGLNFQTIASDTATTGEIVDCEGYKSVTVLMQTGTVTAGDVTISAVFESETGLFAGEETAVDSEELVGDLVALDTANTTTRLGVLNRKRYIRVTYTTANSANLQVGSLIVLDSPYKAATA